MTTIGIICEGSSGGEDEQVLTHLAQRICPAAQLVVRPQGAKPNLIAQCGEVAKALFDSGCDRVLIVWDVYPRWERPDGEQQDIADIQVVLARADLTDKPCLYLVPIQKELEAWLLADGLALSKVLSTQAHPVTVGDTKHAEHNANPKKQLEKVFKRHGRNYAAKTDAIKIMRNIQKNFGMLAKQSTFKKFGHSLTQAC